jgi:putative chitinase
VTDRTPEQWEAVLRKIAPHGKAEIIEGFAAELPRLTKKYHIDTPLRQAHFLAQVAHESDHFQTMEEYASGAAYEGRKDLGNVVKGDGRRFKGRGLIQLTGRYNYTGASKAFDHDFVSHPQDAGKMPWAAEIAAWYWSTHKLNRHADKDDVRGATKAINGGLNGLGSRIAYLDRAKSALA